MQACIMYYICNIFMGLCCFKQMPLTIFQEIITYLKNISNTLCPNVYFSNTGFQNIWYFLKVRQRSIDTILAILQRCNKTFLWCFSLHKFYIQLQYRTLCLSLIRNGGQILQLLTYYIQYILIFPELQFKKVR